MFCLPSCLTAIVCQFLTKNEDHYIHRRWHLIENAPHFGAENGLVDLLRWARDAWNEDVCAILAFHGHLETLKWVRRQGCPWDVDTCAEAAAKGHLAILKWVRSQGCPWNPSTCSEAAM